MAKSPTRKVKLAFYLLCFIQLLLSASLVFLGVYGLTVRDATQLVFPALPVIVLSSGLVLGLLALFGALSGKREVKRSIVAFCVMSILVLGGLIALIATGSGRAGEVDQRLDAGWGAASDGTRVSLQTSFRCCGFRTPSDRPGGGVEACLVSLHGDKPCRDPLEREATLALTALAIGSIVAGVVVLLTGAGAGAVLYMIDYRRQEGTEGFQEDIPMTKLAGSTMHEGSVIERGSTAAPEPSATAKDHL
jgi:hypothetical protein